MTVGEDIGLDDDHVTYAPFGGESATINFRLNCLNHASTPT